MMNSDPDPNLPPASQTPVDPDESMNRALEFLAGFIGCILLNVLLWTIFQSVISDVSSRIGPVMEAVVLLLSMLVLLGNLILLAVALSKRRWIGFGILAAMGISLFFGGGLLVQECFRLVGN
jgi:hypothetical protein